VVAARPVDVPLPERLGIRLDNPAVVVPEPAKLGIKIEWGERLFAVIRAWLWSFTA